jgi:predicted ABC-type ATPase
VASAWAKAWKSRGVSDPVGEKLEFLQRASALGYTVVLCFIGLESSDLSDERVAMRVMQAATTRARRRIATLRA